MGKKIKKAGRVRTSGQKSVTGRKQAGDKQKLVIRLLALLNQPEGKTGTIRQILFVIKDFTGLEAVGIRLRDGEDFPYYEAKGFSKDFVKSEKYLCARNPSGEVVRDCSGRAVLECMCGRVICGGVNQTLPFFTKAGSFWTNSTTELLAIASEEEFGTRTRNRCNRQGYESVALVPLRSGVEIIGLLQLNDRRRDMFTLDKIKFFEEIGDCIGISLARRQAEEVLKRDKETFEVLVRERTEELFRTQKELDKAKRLSDIGKLAATVAHELRNPLGVIRTAAYNIGRKRQNVSLDKHLANIEKKVLESNRIISNLLNYARIKMPHYEKVKINKVLREAVATVKKGFSRQKVSVDMRLDSLKRKTIEADPFQLGEIFDNILNNAYQALPDKKGIMEITGKFDNRSFVKISFKDNGVGIDNKDLKSVFEPFFTRKSKGTGLGLTICNEMVSLHGGKIDIKSKKGKGTTVTVSLPLKRNK